MQSYPPGKLFVVVQATFSANRNGNVNMMVSILLAVLEILKTTKRFSIYAHIWHISNLKPSGLPEVIA